MPPIVQSISCSQRPRRLTRWNLLIHLPSFIRSRLSTLDAQHLSPHLRCDLGLSESDLPSSAGRDFWPR
jgi:uncharacterized protein YjiS (DUF1127 family)